MRRDPQAISCLEKDASHLGSENTNTKHTYIYKIQFKIQIQKIQRCQANEERPTGN